MEQPKGVQFVPASFSSSSIPNQSAAFANERSASVAVNCTPKPRTSSAVFVQETCKIAHSKFTPLIFKHSFIASFVYSGFTKPWFVNGSTTTHKIAAVITPQML